MGINRRSALSLVAVFAVVLFVIATTSIESSAQSYRAPVVLAIAPDVVNCDDPDDPDGVEDVTISGLCFLDRITGAFLSPNADGTGDRVALMNVVNIGNNTIVATVPLDQLTLRDVPYYVFVVRADGRQSTNYPNAFGYDVTFTCTQAAVADVGPSLTSCRVVRRASGGYALQVTGENLRPNDSIVLLDGQPCRRTRYPARFISPADGTTTRIDCTGDLKRLLPAVVTVRNQSDGTTSANALECDFER
jgi:hypothetical protein